MENIYGKDYENNQIKKLIIRKRMNILLERKKNKHKQNDYPLNKYNQYRKRSINNSLIKNNNFSNYNSTISISLFPPFTDRYRQLKINNTKKELIKHFSLNNTKKNKIFNNPVLYYSPNKSFNININKTYDRDIKQTINLPIISKNSKEKEKKDF